MGRSVVAGAARAELERWAEGWGGEGWRVKAVPAEGRREEERRAGEGRGVAAVAVKAREETEREVALRAWEVAVK